MTVLPTTDGLLYNITNGKPTIAKPLTEAERMSRLEGAIIELDSKVTAVLMANSIKPTPVAAKNLESLRADVRRVGAGMIRDAVAAADADGAHER